MFSCDISWTKRGKKVSNWLVALIPDTLTQIHSFVILICWFSFRDRISRILRSSLTWIPHPVHVPGDQMQDFDSLHQWICIPVPKTLTQYSMASSPSPSKHSAYWTYISSLWASHESIPPPLFFKSNVFIQEDILLEYHFNNEYKPLVLHRGCLLFKDLQHSFWDYCRMFDLKKTISFSLQDMTSFICLYFFLF